MNNDEMQKKLEQAIREHVIDQQHDTVPVPLPENMRFHVNCYVKKDKMKEILRSRVILLL